MILAAMTMHTNSVGLVKAEMDSLVGTPSSLMFKTCLKVSPWSQVRRSLYKSSVGKWKRYERQLEETANRLQPLLEEFMQSCTDCNLDKEL